MLDEQIKSMPDLFEEKDKIVEIAFRDNGSGLDKYMKKLKRHEKEDAVLTLFSIIASGAHGLDFTTYIELANKVEEVTIKYLDQRKAVHWMLIKQKLDYAASSFYLKSMED